MLVDAQRCESGETLRTTVCVIGSGPAGLTVASRLAERKIGVIVVETGGVDHEPDAQDLSDVVGNGDSALGGRSERVRSIGGNSTVWSIKLTDHTMGVRYIPLDPIDFVRRDGVAGSGWPIDEHDLVTSYRAAAEIGRMGPFALDTDRWTDRSATTWNLDESVVESKIFRFGPRSAFAVDLVAEAERSPHIRLLHGATVVELEATDAASVVSSARCRRLDGAELTVRADTFVLATGGIGNAHLLLASNSSRPAGLGNGHDLVGRYLQDHVIVDGGSLMPSDPAIWNGSSFYDMRRVHGRDVLGHLALSRQTIERHGLSGLSATMFPRLGDRRTAGLESSRAIAYRAQSRTIDRDIAGEIVRAVSGLDGLAVAGYRKFRHGQSMLHGFGRGGWSEMSNLDRKFTRFEIVHQAEQRPDRNKRVSLTRDRDRVGMPIARIDWRWDHEDARIAGLGRRLLTDELVRAGVGTIRLPDDDGLPGLDKVAGSAHHTGTTRMSASPSTGVVDADGRLHEIDNVFVTGSSVFPTSGYANPTLTIVALAVRLAEHLADRRVRSPRRRRIVSSEGRRGAARPQASAT